MNSNIYSKFKPLRIVPVYLKAREEMDSGFLIIMNEEMEIFYFNSSAKAMLNKIIDTTLTVNALFAYFLLEYEVDKQILKKDIMHFIRDLQWKKIISLQAA